MGRRKKREQAEQKAAEQRAQEESERSLKESLDALTPEQADMFLRALEMTMRKRRLMLLGYLSAALAMVIGTIWSLYMYGVHERGTFIGWVFLVPFAVAGTCMFVFGRLAKRLGTKAEHHKAPSKLAQKMADEVADGKAPKLETDN